MTRPPLDPARLTKLPPPLRELRIVEYSPSTNAQLLDEGGVDGTVLVAEHQSAGVGRLGRAWLSPPRSGLTVSVLMRPPVPRSDWSWLPLLTGLAVVQAVAPVLPVVGVGVGLKWPNDVLLGAGEGKVAGILVQVRGDAAVVGVGLNVSLSRGELPVPTATSLLLAGAREADRTALLVAFLAQFAAEYRAWVGADGDAQASGLAARYRAKCLTLGREVKVSRVEGGEHVGQAADVDGQGRLVLRTEAGLVALDAGDVQHVRPA